MVSLDTCTFTSADELLAGQVKGIDRGFSTGAGVASTKPAGWGEVELFNTGGQNIQVTLPSTSCMTFTDGLGSTLGVENREDHMVAYLRGASVQPATMQGLRPVDASFTGYPDAVHVPNTLLFSPGVTQNMPVDGINRQQQNLTGFPPSPAVTHSSFAATYNTNVAHQHVQANPLSNHVTSNGYNWSTVNEFAFLPSTIDQRLVAKPTQMEPESNLKSGVIEFNSRPQSVHIEPASVLRNALGLSIDNSQPLSRPSQNLSLSLSPHQHTPQLQRLHYDNGQTIGSGISSSPEAAHASADGSGRKGDRQTETWIGTFGVLGSGYQKPVPNGSNAVVPAETNLQMFAGLGVFSGSRYLRAAQTLLEELVSVGRGVNNNNSFRLGHLESSMAPSSLTECSFSKGASLLEKITGASHKEQVACFKSALSTVSDPEQKISTVVEHTSQRNQELQTKKARLLAMLDEVDRRYKQYYNQMQTVVNSFEAAAGFGAAKVYTSLALQTISKHFRSLRDAIGEQIRSASRALGEEDFPLISFGRLRYVDQQMNQQQALQRLGMVQQHTWRPQRGLPERAVVVLRAWLFEHFLHPYPKDADKHMLAKQTGLTRNQVSNWFINARVRLWKPMVEEMYLEELKEADANATRCNRSNLHREDCDNLKSGTTSIVNQQNVAEFDSSSQGYKHGRVEPDSSDEAVVTDEQIVSDYQRAVTNNMLAQVAALDVADPQLFRGAKKSRNGLGMDPSPEGVKLEGAVRDEGLDNGNKQNFNIRGFGSGLETFHLGVMGRGEEDGGFSTVPAGYNDVSLTLGLQHCDTLSLVEAQHQQYYLHQHQQQGLLSHFAGAGL